MVFEVSILDLDPPFVKHVIKLMAHPVNPLWLAQSVISHIQISMVRPLSKITLFLVLQYFSKYFVTIQQTVFIGM